MVSHGQSPGTPSSQATVHCTAWACATSSTSAGRTRRIRSCKYLNNIVAQDHRRIKSRVQPRLGFKKFYNARRVLIGVELLQKLTKGQYRVPRRFGRTLDSIWSNVC